MIKDLNIIKWYKDWYYFQGNDNFLAVGLYLPDHLLLWCFHDFVGWLCLAAFNTYPSTISALLTAVMCQRKLTTKGISPWCDSLWIPANSNKNNSLTTQPIGRLWTIFGKNRCTWICMTHHIGVKSSLVDYGTVEPWYKRLIFSKIE